MLSLSAPNAARAAGSSVVAESCSAEVPILKAGAPSGVAAVARLPALALTSSRVSLNSDVWIYRAVVLFLGFTLLMTVGGGIALSFVAKADAKVVLPEALVAIGSAAVGALAGLLAPSPVRNG